VDSYQALVLSAYCELKVVRECILDYKGWRASIWILDFKAIVSSVTDHWCAVKLVDVDYEGLS